MTPGRAATVGLAAALLALLIRAPFGPMLGETVPFITFFPAIALAAWLGGLTGGLVATAASAALAGILILPPAGVLAVDEVASLVVFIAAGALTSAIGGQLHRALAVAERARVRAVFLADASAVLTGRLDRVATIEAVARAAVHAFADWCEIDLVDDGDPERFVASRVAAADARQVELGEALRREFPLEPGAASGPPAIVRTGEAEVVLDVPSGTDQSIDDPRSRERTARLGVQSSIGVPLVTPDRRRLGVLTLAMTASGRRFTREDVDAAFELGRRVGVALDYAALFRAVRARSEELTAVIEGLTDAVLIADPGGAIRSHNPAAGPIVAAAAGGTLDAVLDSLRPVAGRNDMRQVAATGRFVQPIVLDVAAEGERSRVVILRDVTDLLESEAARDAFLGMLSHELRTPITTIYGSSRMLLKPLDEEVRHSLTEDLADETDRLYRLVEDLLVLSRFERGRLDIAPEPVLVQRVLSRVLSREGQRAPALRIDMHVRGSLPPALADATYIEQVVRNLVSNAAKYAGREAAIGVRAWADGGFVNVEVEDDGPGVPEADRERVFALYERLAERRDPMTPGAGIGLFVCRRLVEAMGGRMSVRRGAGGGACFTFTLPAMAASEGREPAAG